MFLVGANSKDIIIYSKDNYIKIFNLFITIIDL